MGACEFIFYFWGLDRGIVIFWIEGVCACVFVPQLIENLCFSSSESLCGSVCGIFD